MGFGKYAVTNLAASRPIALRKCWICVVLCCVVLGTELHGFSDIGGAKVDHHWICVTINNIGIMRVSIGYRVFFFHHLHRGEKWVSESVSEWVVVVGWVPWRSFQSWHVHMQWRRQRFADMAIYLLQPQWSHTPSLRSLLMPIVCRSTQPMS